jgi:hypothetical protein
MPCVPSNNRVGNSLLSRSVYIYSAADKKKSHSAKSTPTAASCSLVCVIAAMNLLNLNLRTYQFEYSISRPITRPWFAPIFFSVGLIYVIVITFINVVAVGYDTINYNSIVYNETHSLWYDKLVPFRGSSYNHRSCETALLKLNDCSLIQV